MYFKNNIKAALELWKTVSLKMNVFGFAAIFLLFTSGLEVGSQHIQRGKKKLEEGLDRNDLLDFVQERIKKSHHLKDKCMIKLIEEAIDPNGSTYLFIKDNKSHGTLLDDLQAHFVNSFHTDPDEFNNWKHVSFHHLLIFNDNFEVEDVIQQMSPVQGTKFFILVNDYREAREKFEKLWEYRIIDAVASFVINDTVYCYAYAPYSVTHCGGVGVPHLVAQCHVPNAAFYQKQPFFPRKTDNLHRCPINITFTEIVPSSYYGDSSRLTGWEIEIMNEIIQHINGVPKYNIWVSNTRKYKKLKGYSDLVKNSDVGGGLAVSLKSLIKTDFCMYGQTLCATWIVPKSGNARHSVAFLYKVFPTEVWVLIFLCFLIMAATYTTFFRVTFANVLFKLLPYLVGTTTRTKKVSKTLGALWLWFCLVITSIYQSGYHSTLMVPDLPQQLTTTKDVLQSNLKILGVSDLIIDAIPYYKRKYNVSSRRLRLIHRKLSYEDWVYRMAVKKDSAFLGFKEIVRYHIDRTELANTLHVPETCAIKYMLSFVLKKNSHLTENFIKYSLNLNEYGFVVFFLRRHLSRESRRSIPKSKVLALKPNTRNGCDLPPSIDMDKMSMVFMCHAVGLALATVVFFIEIASKKLREKFKEPTKNLVSLQRTFPNKRHFI